MVIRKTLAWKCWLVFLVTLTGQWLVMPHLVPASLTGQWLVMPHLVPASLTGQWLVMPHLVPASLTGQWLVMPHLVPASLTVQWLVTFIMPHLVPASLTGQYIVNMQELFVAQVAYPVYSLYQIMFSCRWVVTLDSHNEIEYCSCSGWHLLNNLIRDITHNMMPLYKRNTINIFTFKPLWTKIFKLSIRV